jgi:hypothetical protein
MLKTRFLYKFKMEPAASPSMSIILRLMPALQCCYELGCRGTNEFAVAPSSFVCAGFSPFARACLGPCCRTLAIGLRSHQRPLVAQNIIAQQPSLTTAQLTHQMAWPHEIGIKG